MMHGAQTLQTAADLAARTVPASAVGVGIPDV